MAPPDARLLRSDIVLSPTRLHFVACPFLLIAGCGGEIYDVTGGGTGGSPPTCDAATLVFEPGDSDGHADPFGAKAAGQARAGRIQASDLPQPAANRQRIEDGDFVLANDQIAVVIEDRDVSDGYGRFGGEIIAVDRVGEDGVPLGLSMFIETLQLTSAYQINPTSVSVMNDGANGEAAVVRVTGALSGIPFLIDTFGAVFPPQYADLVAAYDYVLAPGSEKITIRFGLINPTEYDVDTGLNIEGSWDLLGFFQGSQNDLFIPGRGYGEPGGSAAFVGFDNASLPFAYQGASGAPLDYGGISLSGFSLFSGPGMVVTPCSLLMEDNHEIVVGAPGGGIDGLGAAYRRANGLPEQRQVTGTVSDANGAGVAGAFVHALDSDGAYQSRAITDATGTFSIHVPDGAVTLVPQKRGYPASDGVEVLGSETQASLSFDENGFIHVLATEAGTGAPLPVRIQVIPAVAPPTTPEHFGFQDEVGGRLWQEFSVSGDATLPVPVGSHQVVVSRGQEWEILDTTVDVAAGATVEVAAPLLHSVATTGAISADFHIHSMFSADSNDPVITKVKGALADGLDVPVSSEHEWIIDFQPVIEQLGATQWAFGLPSEELTTFTFGHFGVVPVAPRPELVNNGAVDWLDKTAQQIFDEVHALPGSPALIVNHPSGDSAFQAYFNAVGFDRATGGSDNPLWSESFDAIEVFNDSNNGGTFDGNRDESVADWFALLNAGKTFWAVGSSDSHRIRTSPVGYPRTYLFVGYDDVQLASGDDVRDSILSGSMTVSGGLYMTVEGPGASGPGQTIAKTPTADFIVTVRCPSWIDADTLEVIVNGETVATEALAPVGAGPAKEFVNNVSVTLPAGPRAWVLFHAKGPGDLAPVHPGRVPFAVSNPILFQE